MPLVVPGLQAERPRDLRQCGASVVAGRSLAEPLLARHRVGEVPEVVEPAHRDRSRARSAASRASRASSRRRRSASTAASTASGWWPGGGGGATCASTCVGQPRAERGAGHRVERRRAVEELADGQREPVGQRRHVGAGGPAARCGGIVAGRTCGKAEPLAHDVGAGDHVAEPLAARVHQRADERRDPDEHPDLHEPDERADEGVPERDRAGVVADGAQPERHLPSDRPRVSVSIAVGSTTSTSTVETSAATAAARRRRTTTDHADDEARATSSSALARAGR